MLFFCVDYSFRFGPLTRRIVMDPTWVSHHLPPYFYLVWELASPPSLTYFGRQLSSPGLFAPPPSRHGLPFSGWPVSLFSCLLLLIERRIGSKSTNCPILPAHSATADSLVALQDPPRFSCWSDIVAICRTPPSSFFLPFFLERSLFLSIQNEIFST